MAKLETRCFPYMNNTQFDQWSTFIKHCQNNSNLPHTAIFLQICFMGILFKNTSTKWVPQKTKNVALEKFLEWNHPQTSLLLSRRGPRCPDARLSQHYISPKMICCNFSNFCRKKFPGLTKEISCTYWMNLEVLPHDFCKLQPPKLYQNFRNFFVKPGNFFLQKFEKLQHVIFGLM